LRHVLDTNIAVAALNGIPAVRSRLSEVKASDVGIPLVAVAELIYGAHVSQRRDENMSRVAALRRSIPTLPLTDEIVDRYGATRASLRARGISKSDFDLVIASTALEQDAVLVTDDRALLDGTIPGLKTENWLART
jgi:tRNA(fMet)-specific endonuclease VapC